MKDISQSKFYSILKFCIDRGILFLLLLLPFLLEAEKPFILFTVPKSGTHLAKKLFEELSGKEGKFLYMPGPDFDEVYPQHFSSGIFYFMHYRDWSWMPKQKDLYKDFKVFVNVRDPRDVCVSSAFFFYKELSLLLGKDATIRDRLRYIIETTTLHDGLHDFFGPLALHQKAFEIIDLYKPVIIRFEDLIGPAGGGDLKKQVLLIRKVAGKLGIPLTDAKAGAIGKKIYGNSLTFREGQIGSWKYYFTEELKNAFKQSGLEDYLIKLGYEEDHDW